MRKIPVVCLATILATYSFSFHIWARGNQAAEKHQPATTSTSAQRHGQTGRVLSQKDGNGRFKIEVRNGSAVSLRATQLRAKNNGFARAYADLIKRGGKPLFDEAGVSIVALDTSRASVKNAAATSPQQIIEGDYEMTFFPFDTGNDAIWEGAVYVRGPGVDGTIRDGSWAVSHSTTHQDSSQVEVYYEAYYPGGGGVLNPVSMPARDGWSVKKAVFSATDSGAAPVPMQSRFFREWMFCVARDCAGFLVGCILLGPLYWNCVALGCASSLIHCLEPRLPW